MNWISLEAHVRAIASLRWGKPCAPEHIDGVDFDAVVRISESEIIIIEITQQRTLEKVRSDINKIMPVRLRLATEGKICRSFIVLSKEPTLSMTDAGDKVHISILSSKAFEKVFFDFDSYDQLRRKMPFGSAVDTKTGGNDPRKYIKVKYEQVDGRKEFSAEDVISKLILGAKITLTGDFGSGKSRCVREIYENLSSRTREAGAFPVAINLRDHWSSSSAQEILAGHLGNVGTSSSNDNFMRLLNNGSLILLLDGFDEVGTQSHDTSIDDRKALRRRAVQGVRDLVSRSNAGVLATGRSHFFDDDVEMLNSLGISMQSTGLEVLKAPDSFTKIEGEKYLRDIGIDVFLPKWLPRKPLVFQVIADLNVEEITKIITMKHGEFEFWGAFLNAICVRESKGVSNSVSPLTVKFILLELADKTRYSTEPLGRISQRDMDEAYEKAVGTAPDQSGIQLLSRMCTIGRIEPESPDRQFVDYNMLDILRAESLVLDVDQVTETKEDRQWRQSMRPLGVLHASKIVGSFGLEQFLFSYLRKNGGSRNTKKLGEIVSVLSVTGNDRLDFQNLNVRNSFFPILDISTRVVENLKISDSEILALWLDGSPIKEEHSFQIEGSIVYDVAGISSQEGLPTWMKETEVLNFDIVNNANRIRESPLSPQQKTFLSIVHKIFFQSGSGRQEKSLSKGGYGLKYSPKLVEEILKLLVRESVVEKTKGNDGFVYKPVRRHTERMNKIRSELTLSEDSLWIAANEVKG